MKLLLLFFALWSAEACLFIGSPYTGQTVLTGSTLETTFDRPIGLCRLEIQGSGRCEVRIGSIRLTRLAPMTLVSGVDYSPLRAQKVQVTCRSGQPSLTVTAGIPDSTPNANTTYRLNAGGPAIGTFAADNPEFFRGGQPQAEPCLDCIDRQGVFYPGEPRLYTWQRWGSDFEYAFPHLVPSVTYAVRLHFAETYFEEIGQREFNLEILGLEGRVRVATNYDIFAQTGGNFRAHATRFFAKPDSRGVLRLHFFDGKANHPTLAGIEISPYIPRKLEIGIFDDAANQGLPLGQMADLDLWLGRPTQVVGIFTETGARLPSEPLWEPRSQNQTFRTAEDLWALGYVPLIALEWQYGNVSDDVEVEMAMGHWAQRLEEWVLGGPYFERYNLRTYLAGGRKLYLRMAHEFNGNWYPWSGNPVAYRQGYTRIWRLIRDAGFGPNQVQFLWSPFSQDLGLPAEAYWPGSPYVDWIAPSGHNWGRDPKYPWSTQRSAVRIFNHFLDHLCEDLRLCQGRSLSIPEVSSGSWYYAPHPSNKAHWIRDLYDYAAEKSFATDTSRIKQVVYFNKHKETDWSVFELPVKDPGFVGVSNITYGTSLWTSSLTGKVYNVYESYREAVNRLQAEQTNFIGFQHPTWTLVWADDFDSLDPAKWRHEVFCDNGNGENQCYTRDPDLAYVADGVLHLRAKCDCQPLTSKCVSPTDLTHQAKAGFATKQMCRSARLRTATTGKAGDLEGPSASFKGGPPLKIEVRVKLPYGRWLWPAIWMLPFNWTYGETWCASGEIDLFEQHGQEACETQHTLCSKAYPGQTFETSGPLNHCTFGDSIGNMTDRFHTVSLEWFPDYLEWFVDGFLTHRQVLLGNLREIYREEFYLVMNLAIGGNYFNAYQRPTWGEEAVDPSLYLGTWTQPELIVDWLRVYRPL